MHRLCHYLKEQQHHRCRDVERCDIIDLLITQKVTTGLKLYLVHSVKLLRGIFFCFLIVSLKVVSDR